MNAKVSLSFARLPDPDLITKTDHIIDRMKNNVAYPTPVPTLASLQTAVTFFQDKLAESRGGDRLKVAEKNAAREALLAKLRLLALYVGQECDGDLPTLLSSGYDPQKERTPAGVLPAPEALTLTQATISGQLALRARPVQNAASYVTQLTTDVTKEDSWGQDVFSTGARVTLTNLDPGSRYWVRMQAIGSAGPGAWSEPTAAYAI